MRITDVRHDDAYSVAPQGGMVDEQRASLQSHPDTDTTLNPGIGLGARS